MDVVTLCKQVAETRSQVMRPPLMGAQTTQGHQAVPVTATSPCQATPWRVSNDTAHVGDVTGHRALSAVAGGKRREAPSVGKG